MDDHRFEEIASRMLTEISRNSWASELECPECRVHYDLREIRDSCRTPGCSSPLYTLYQPTGVRSPADICSAGYPGMWRYRKLLPVIGDENIVTLGEGETPLLPFVNLRTEKELLLYWKDESGNPTGSFKSRGMSVAVSKAKELGVKGLVTPTAGNAGGAMAAYCARAGLKAHVFMPVQTPELFKREVRYYGAQLTEVKGNIADCGALATAVAANNGWFSVATLREPYRLEGKKTMGFEIAEQLDWQVPDVILYPTGGGTGLLGIWKAFDELQHLGIIGPERPRMVAVQSDRCDGIVRAFQAGAAVSSYTDNGFTIANGLRVPKPFADRQILRVLHDSGGTAITINDAAMQTAMAEIARKEGMLVAPEGAAVWAALNMLCAADWIADGERVVLINTGSGYKYLENIVH